MTADKIALKAELYDLFVNLGFGLGLIDNNELLELNSFKDCDVIFLCAPVNKNIEYLTQLKDIIKDDCIITDVGVFQKLLV